MNEINIPITQPHNLKRTRMETINWFIWAHKNYMKGYNGLCEPETSSDYSKTYYSGQKMAFRIMLDKIKLQISLEEIHSRDYSKPELEDNPPLQGDYQTHSITTGEQ